MTTPQPYSPRDFVRIPGTAERRVNLVTGTEVSRRQYQAQIGQPLPKQVSDRPTLYVKLVRQEAALSGRTRRQVQQDINFKANWRHLRDLWRAEARGELVDHSPSGDLAETMRQLGMKHDAQWWVGETP